jgi:DNA-directed RNA polymerase omega subunit
MADITNQRAMNAVGNAFILSLLLAERIKELRHGARPLISTDSKDPAAIAFREIAEGKLTYKLSVNKNE